MIYLSLPTDEPRILPFYLAMEEYAARIVGDEDFFFMWQVAPTVIYGRNQVAEWEVNLPYCRAHDIAVYRRKSGGGCVYADRGNVMLSNVSRDDRVEPTFKRYTGAVVASLRQLGLNACDNSRNDILIDGLKVSGNAFYHLPGRSIVHGTLLYDTHMAHMTQAITPSRAKLASKGVASVPSHITTLREHTHMSLEDIKRHLRESLCDSERMLDRHDVAAIDKLMLDYLRPEFIDGRRSRRDTVPCRHIERVGELRIDLQTDDDNLITGLDITGDYFLLSDLDSSVIARVVGCRRTVTALTAALADIDVSRVIMNLTNQQLINLLTQTNNE